MSDIELEIGNEPEGLPGAPGHLSESAQKLWSDIQAFHSIVEPQQVALLETAMEAYDRIQEAKKEIKEHGILTPDRFEQLKKNPACDVERDNRAQLLAIFTKMGLNFEPLRGGPGRPTNEEQMMLDLDI